ncbi:MAG: TatD family hydrolase [Lachnospiraceae bacterium]|nr:TatD family hydrolase [Lachnospiraceae bacterium]
MIFETHAHYDDDAFDEDRELLLEQLPKQGIGRVVNIGASLKSCQKTLDLMEKYDYIYGAIGVHPNETGELNEENFAWLKKQCEHKKCVAVGEIGLDYYWDEPERQVQKEWFRRQLRLAKEMDLPVVIHSRDAAQDTIQIMKEEHAEEIGGVVHCFAYTKETAQIFLDMGFYIGVGGVITFKNGKKLKEAVEDIPLERIVLETDSPYLSPEPYRGKRNSSLNLPFVVEQIASIKNVTPEEVERVTYENALKLYRLS